MTTDMLRCALRGVAAYRPIVDEPVMRLALGVLDKLAAGDGSGAVEDYARLFYALRSAGSRSLGEWLDGRLRDRESPYAALVERGGEDPALEAAARSAGMSNEEIKKYPTNAALQQAVNEKTKAQREALIREILAMEGHPAESELQNKTLDELKAIKAQLAEQAAQRAALIAEIKALAAELGVTVTDQELAAMSLEQLAAKKQELANQKLMNSIIAEIKKLKPDYDPTGKTLEQLQQDLAALQQNPPTPPTPPTPGGEGGEGGSGEGGGANPAASGTSGEGTTA